MTRSKRFWQLVCSIVIIYTQTDNMLSQRPSTYPSIHQFWYIFVITAYHIFAVHHSLHIIRPIAYHMLHFIMKYISDLTRKLRIDSTLLSPFHLNSHTSHLKPLKKSFIRVHHLGKHTFGEPIFIFFGGRWSWTYYTYIYIFIHIGSSITSTSNTTQTIKFFMCFIDYYFATERYINNTIYITLWKL